MLGLESTQDWKHNGPGPLYKYTGGPGYGIYIHYVVLWTDVPDAQSGVAQRKFLCVYWPAGGKKTGIICND